MSLNILYELSHYHVSALRATAATCCRAELWLTARFTKGGDFITFFCRHAAMCKSRYVKGIIITWSNILTFQVNKGALPGGAWAYLMFYNSGDLLFNHLNMDPTQCNITRAWQHEMSNKVTQSLVKRKQIHQHEPDIASGVITDIFKCSVLQSSKQEYFEKNKRSTASGSVL